MSVVMTIALLMGQAGDVPPDPLGGGVKPAAKAGGADELLKEPGAKPAAPAAGGDLGKPQDFKPAAPGAAADGAAPPADGAAAPDAAASEAKPASESSVQIRSWSEWWGDLSKSGALGLMISGGFFMWPILAMGVLSAGVIIERWRTLSMLDVDTSNVQAQVRELVKADRAEDALELCSQASGPSAAIVTAGLRRYLVLRKLGYDPARIAIEVNKSMETYGSRIVHALEKHLPVLSNVSSVAPMVGSVGTVWGMIILFQDIVAQFGVVNIILAAAAGIKLKLLVTVWGLIVGIPAYVAHNRFTTNVGDFVVKIEAAANDLYEAIVEFHTPGVPFVHATSHGGSANGENGHAERGHSDGVRGVSSAVKG